MKKLTFLLSAVALLGLASCTEPQEINPNYDAVKNEVVTSFAFNVATKAQTKGTAADTQADGSFRGMDQMDLLVATEHPAGAEFQSQYHYQLGTLASNAISESKSSKIYSLSIPLGVNNMVFYGHATKASGANPQQLGKLSYNVGNTKATTHFDLASISAESVASHEGTVAQQFGYRTTVLAAILNDVMAAEGWKAYAKDQARTDVPVYGYPLWDAYNELTTLQTKEFRAGAGKSVVRMLNDLKAICAGITGTGSIVPEGDAARTVAQKITEKIGLYIETDTFFDMTNLQSKGALATGAAHDAAMKLKTGDLRDFPRLLGLPSGAAQLTYDETNGFSYVMKAQSFGAGKTGVDLDKYAFPAELAYWACSPIRVTSDAVTNDDFPVTVTTWDNDNWGAKNWVKNGTVSSDTKGVALQNNINYGTALLKTTVAVKDDGSKITDNRQAILERRAAAEGIDPTTITEGDQEFSASDLSGKFNLEGILIGGQPSGVTWNWAPASGAKFENVVYDKYIGSGTGVTVPFTEPVYTMVLDNLLVGQETAKQNVVYVALELRNNLGKDFYGNSNIVRDGGIFYLVGALDLSKVDITTAHNNYPVNTDGNGYRFPPLTAQHNGSGTDYSNHEVIRVFMQDFVTEAKFTITSLKNAYVTVPDLRAVEMKFGLSVDLKWKGGLSFDVELGAE